MDQHQNDKPVGVPTDAREPTEEQLAEEAQLEQQNVDPDAPGAQQSADQLADESRR
ncbi:hypothetical protein [Mycobacterium asiaticum]|uniref:hypothetical protein n=1 Tax=Mycobacterium asiaticum TaxID=1790 RepID=UPI000AB665D9|nr:hypothetical protein [Mycobacterium asiaticum]